VEVIEDTSGNSEALQSESFDPGATVNLVSEGSDEDGDEIIGVWNVDETRRAGSLPYPGASRVAAAVAQGLSIDALVLSESRARFDDRRWGLAMFVYPPALVSVDTAAGGPLQRPENRTRPRLVLLADGGKDLRWWDPSGARGPMSLTDVPVSPQLADEMRELQEALQRGEPDSDSSSDSDFFEDMEQSWRQYTLATRTRALWQRARLELGRRYAVGLMLPGMSAPVWSPEEVSEDDDESGDVPF
jgi:hypothetical protein